MTIRVNSKFDAGSIEVVDIGSKVLQFKIRNDTNSHFAQWFYFQLSGVKDKDLTLQFNDLDKTAYPDGWQDYNMCFSYDNQNWFRLSTSFDGKSIMKTKLSAENDIVYIAYFEPYSYQRHIELISNASNSSLVKHEVLGLTGQGRNIDLLVVGDSALKSKVWIIARQHPGETMAEWFMEGLVQKLLDSQDATSRKLLQKHVFYLVPNMNPDGAYLGNLRTNSFGVNLNREWLSPSIEKSPEVYYVREKMQQVGANMFFDIHGDEAIPYIFTAGCEENPNFTSEMQDKHDAFISTFLQIAPDYQNTHGYEKGHFSAEMATVGTNWVGGNFKCLAQTLEMPFKDNNNFPDDETEWNGYRSYLLGQNFLTVINCL